MGYHTLYAIHVNMTDVPRDIDSRTKSQVCRRALAKHARTKALSMRQECAVCGYALHVECCHLIRVGDFPADALVSEINAISNLVLLCPNHHWELDRGVLGYDGCGRWNRTTLLGV